MDFILSNWKFLVISFIAVLSLIFMILLLIKKPIKYEDSALSRVLEKLPELINVAESYYKESGSGSLKLDLVLSMAQAFYSQFGGVVKGCTGRTAFNSIIQSEVEKILTTPVKKGN